MADLIQRVKTTRFNLKRAVRMVSPNTPKGETPNIFREAIRRQVRDSLWSDPDVEFIEQDAHTFPIQTRNASGFTTVETASHCDCGREKLERLYEDRRRRSNGGYTRPNPERERPVMVCGIEIVKDTKKIFVTRFQYDKDSREKSGITRKVRDEVPLLFQYKGKYIFANLQFYDPRDPDAQSPLRGYERARMNLQRLLGKYVHYWAIVNKDFLDVVDFRELGRFTRMQGNTFVTIDVTLEDEDRFLEALKKKYKLIRPPAKRRRRTTKIVTMPSLESKEIFSQYSQKPQSAFEETLRH